MLRRENGSKMAWYHTSEDENLIEMVESFTLEPSIKLPRRHFLTKVIIRDMGVCSRCGLDTKEVPVDYCKELWEADHRIPLSWGGPDTMENIRTLCIPCHRLVTKMFFLIKKIAVCNKARKLLLKSVDTRGPKCNQ